jgi:hypothetical protein
MPVSFGTQNAALRRLHPNIQQERDIRGAFLSMNVDRAT